MSKSIKLKDNNYIDSSSIEHNRKTLKEILNSTIAYSMSEQVIGAWVNKKPIYRKVIETVVTKTSGFVVGTANNFEMLVNINGYFDNLGYVTSILQYWSEDLKSILQVEQKTGDIYLNASSGLLNKYIYVIVEYTKTTD